MSDSARVALQLFNTRTQRKEVFAPLEAGHARVYCCGPTVYSPQHIGNMRANVFADLLVRALRLQDLRVTHVVNVTDVGHLVDDERERGDDKMEVAARESGRRAADIAAEFTAQWQRDRARLNCTPPTVLCRATEHINEQIEMIQRIEAAGASYLTDDGLYFDVARFPRYAELARLDLARQQSGRRASAQGKRNPQDFALWKRSAPDAARQQEWDSPWGCGFPGWHIECSAMSVKYLGTRFDIHAGGVEHWPVHHTNETAQSETAFAVHPWVNVWLHHDWLLFEGEKISKSSGRAVVLDDLLARGVPPLALRYFFLQAHYRKQQHWNDEACAAATAGYRRLLARTQPLLTVASDADALAAAKCAPLVAQFRAALCDDLNAPRALAVAVGVARDTTLAAPARRALLEEFDRWLGLDLFHAPAHEPEHAADEVSQEVAALLEAREAARAARNFELADSIRAQLDALGVSVEDTPDGPRVHYKPARQSGLP